MKAYSMVIPDPLMKMAIHYWAERQFADGRWQENDDGIVFLDEVDAAFFTLTPEYEQLRNAGSTELVAIEL